MTVPARSFQHYEVLRRDDGTPWELGRGAMGVTYKAFDVNLCCEVALKVVSSALVEHPEARERFVREARAAAALRHRNVASVYHLGNDGEHFFYAMEFIEGDTLDALVRREGPLSVENTLQVILQVARALAAAERQHLVHRDIKPANLMVTHEDADEETVVKVIDFGLARAAATAENAAPLTMGGFVGTPQYASPEQLEERPLDARSDLYSLGVTAWFLLTGRVPFTGSLATICQQQLTHPPPWDQLPATVPTCVRGLLGHLLAKDPARRPQTAAELRAEIEACLEKVRGTERKRDLHLPALTPPAPPPRHRPPRTTEHALQAGAVLNRRYRLLRRLGGSHGVQVFQARDDSEGDKLVVIRVLPAGFASDPTGWKSLADEVRLVQAATHPRLVQIHALDRCALPAATFLVEEWLAGFTVRDLLAGRGGRLPVEEALSLLEQAAAAADHAARCRLEPLELALTDLHVTFPVPGGTPGDNAQIRTLLPERFVEWPEWTLKIHALRPNHDPSTLATWAGNVTLTPTPGREERTQIPSGAWPVQALAALFYELLGAVPLVRHPSTEAQPARYSSLPVLNEEANELLRQAVSGEGGFVHGWQLHEALTEAVGQEPARREAPFSEPKPEPGLLAGVAGTPASQSTRLDRRGPTQESDVSARASLAGPVSTGGLTSTESVAPFFRDQHDLMAWDPEEAPATGSAWDRLTLVAEKRAHPGRWLAGIVGLSAIFVLGFVGVLVWLLQQPPSRGAAVPTIKKRAAEAQASPTGRPVPRQSTPAPLAARPLASAIPIPTPTHHESSLPLIRTASAQVEQPPSPNPTATPRTESVPPTPPATESSPSPTVAPVKDRLVTVRMESVPEGAQIRLRGELLGTTPLRTHLPPGDHQLIARYHDWPETRQTVHLDGTDTQTSVEIRIMRPDLVPGSVAAPVATPNHRVRRAPTPVVQRAPSAETPFPSPAQASPSLPVTPTPNVSEPEVRPAQRVLTPFRIDEPPATSPPPLPSDSPSRQPFSAGDDGDN